MGGSRSTRKGGDGGNEKRDEKAHWDDVLMDDFECLYLSDVFALHLRPLDLPFIPEYCEEGIRDDLG